MLAVGCSAQCGQVYSAIQLAPFESPLFDQKQISCSKYVLYPFEDQLLRFLDFIIVK